MADSSRSLTQTIVQDLGQAIIAGVYTPENPFPIEAELCKQFNVSRSVLREAVKMLTSKGLLSARPRQGTWVQPEKNWNLLDSNVLNWMVSHKPSIDLLIEFTETRLAIEPKAAYFAATRATPIRIDKISQSISRMKLASCGERDPFQSDFEFHVAVLESSENRFFCQLKELIAAALKLHIRFQNALGDSLPLDFEYHEKVTQGILNRDPDTAEKAMRDLLMHVLTRIQTIHQSESIATAETITRASEKDLTVDINTNDSSEETLNASKIEQHTAL
ncbi:FadR/GntR family transcriptional regulator [Marinibactrum halimedae]|uniref:GntR family transcriptional regulator n=1 Tax=Marinibactrum halimedae TaxID=1444977 RepID=A0AA37T8B8_9GAMM|nr:FadR/GntR family transcriptional regulator [Marinibactrum halimedae]MCD9459342.1 FadR family transcriptional regulator [Marinibactrum halimedae]GLS25766.1 GntR family transcriptional regulator [Marinibactrum halimedae]